MTAQEEQKVRLVKKMLDDLAELNTDHPVIVEKTDSIYGEVEKLETLLKGKE